MHFYVKYIKMVSVIIFFGFMCLYVYKIDIIWTLCLYIGLGLVLQFITNVAASFHGYSKTYQKEKEKKKHL